MLSVEKKLEWTQALRSGDFEQGAAFLYDPRKNTYCCLGVLCQINNVPKTEDNLFSCEQPDSLVPNQILDLGLSKENCRNLAFMNDSTDYTKKPFKHRFDFNAIADYIDNNL